MYPHCDWLETLAYLKGEMEKIDFDIALPSCGSYAMPLGLHARDVTGKKAVYVGGVLQLLFGVIGRRYEDPFFLDVINKDAYIHLHSTFGEGQISSAHHRTREAGDRCIRCVFLRNICAKFKREELTVFWMKNWVPRSRF